MRRWAETVLAGSLVALAAVPFIVLFPEPPAFGRAAAGIVAAVAILATVGTAFRAAAARRRCMLGWAGILLALTVASVAARIVLATTSGTDVPTLDVLPAVLGLQGEDIDDALLYEGWLELWLGCALATLLAIGLRRASHPRSPRRPVIAPPRDIMVPKDAARPPWNAATVVLWLIGWAVLGGAILNGHRTAEFLDEAVHVTGTIADPQPHPRIRFTAASGVVVEFTQNGWVSRALGAAVPVAYLTSDPAGTARADTFWADWSDLLGLLWVGLGFTLFPFYGLRARSRAGRW